ncbi:MAG: hypothetical protein M1820_000506 [Bogoriella megaspora]|nr:MAG: hypothetical protein M1820_000506 [Bogoriella megaspora]
MKPPYPALVSEWHNAPYPAIDPSSPALSHAGETVVVTGGGSGIGQATALAFAAAGATKIVLLGRRDNKLQETRDRINEQSPGCAVQTYAVSVTQAKEVKYVAEKVNRWDVLVLSTGRMIAPKNIQDEDPDKWWDALETNLRGFFVTLHAFLPSRKTGARVVGVSAGIVNLPAVYPVCQGASSYVTSKLAQIRLLEHVAAECPDLFVVVVHPGIVATDLMKESTVDQGENMEKTLLDDGQYIGIAVYEYDCIADPTQVDLPAGFFVWATTKEAAFLRGKFCYANWDVEQLKARAKEIQETPILTPNILGWPYEVKS